MKNKGFIILFAVNILLVIADFVSTLLNGDLVQYLESNPLYKYGGLLLIFIVNILLYGFFYIVYNSKRPNITSRFFIIFAMSMFMVLRIFTIYANLHVAYGVPQEIAEHNNISIEQAKQIQLAHAMTTTDEQRWNYTQQIVMPYIIPYIFVIIAWYIFKIDHNIEVK